MEPLQKPFIIRVSGIETTDHEEAEQIVRAVIARHCSADEHQEPSLSYKLTIVPSCDDPCFCDSIVDFQKGQRLPAFLSELQKHPLEPLSLPYDEAESEYLTFDCNFHGFTQLYSTPADQPILADVIAITGLDGHAYGSWTAKKQPWHMWLRHFLKKDLPGCRTMIYGYDSKLSENGLADIKQYRDELIQQLRLVRKAKEVQQRPVIFIAHSFGGIILARAIVKAQQREDDVVLKSLFVATHAIAFFGVPHYGMVVDDIRKVISEEHPRHQLLEQISTGDQSLSLELDHFIDVIKDRKIKSFVEGKQSQDLVQDTHTQRWQREGTHINRLSYNDAILRLPNHMEEKFTIQENHSNIVKFASKAGSYKVVLAFLKESIQEAPAIVSQRFNPRTTRTYSTIPFGRDKSFIGRESLLQNLDVIFTEQNRAGIFGLGGIGKSQIAIEYAYRVQNREPDRHLFWVHAGNHDRFIEAFREIAAVCEIPGRDDPNTNILHLVSQWLKINENGSWLLILDNVDDEKTLSTALASEFGMRLIDFVPEVPHGKILITSRSRNAAGMIVGHKQLCKVDVMGEQECLALMKTRLGNEVPEEDLRLLCKRLDSIPLAIVQACSYLNQTELVSVSAYIDSISGDNGDLLRRPWMDLRRDKGVSNAVIDAFAISFTYIQENHELAFTILSIMAQYDRQGIPKFLLQAVEELEDDSLTASNDFLLDEALSRLLDFSMIKTGDQGASFDIHSLIQLSVVEWERSRGTLQQVQDQALRAMNIVAPDCEYENWPTWRVLSPHTSTIMNANEHNRSEEYADLLRFFSGYLQRMGNFELALQKAEASVEVRQNLYGVDNVKTLASMLHLAAVYSDLGNYDKAAQLGAEVVEKRVHILGPEHLDTLTSMFNLASTYGDLGQYEKAAELGKEAMEKRIELLGSRHPDTLTSMSGLATLYRDLDQYDKAAQLGKEVMEKRIEIFGSEHTDTLTSMSGLALAYGYLEQYDKAVKLAKEVMEKRIDTSGPDHPYTLTSMSNLAVAYYQMGQYDKAARLGRKVLKKRIVISGSEHPDTLTCMAHLARTYSDMGQYDKAAKLGEEELEKCVKVLGPEHPETLSSLHNHACTLNLKGQHSDALYIMKCCVVAKGRVLGLTHPSTLASIDRMQEWEELHSGEDQSAEISSSESEVDTDGPHQHEVQAEPETSENPWNLWKQLEHTFKRLANW